MYLALKGPGSHARSPRLGLGRAVDFVAVLHVAVLHESAAPPHLVISNRSEKSPREAQRSMRSILGSAKRDLVSSVSPFTSSY